MNSTSVIDHIVAWLKSYAQKANAKGFIIGISGGIDSAVTSALCAKTGLHVLAVSMPIHQKKDQLVRAHDHLNWLKVNFPQVQTLEQDLTVSFDSLKGIFPPETCNHHLSMANTRSRLRMLTLYALGQTHGLLVAGTGNKIEDFGVGFYTKYGDGGVDLSPIADLTKSQVFQLGKDLKIIESIQLAKPTDGLWEEERTDEDQLGATYPELEWAMEYVSKYSIKGHDIDAINTISTREKEVLKIYLRFNTANKHKMDPIPVCLIPHQLLK